MDRSTPGLPDTLYPASSAFSARAETPMTTAAAAAAAATRAAQSHRPRSIGPNSSRPVTAGFGSENIVFAAGVAIFHLATARVVVCYHPAEKYWFLPKGRRDAGEESGVTAIREGFEESGYRCRLLPLPIPHCQPQPHIASAAQSANASSALIYTTEPLWTQLVPVQRTRQYILSWYVAETLPYEAERATSIASLRESRHPSASHVPGTALNQEGWTDVELAKTTGFAVPPAFLEGMTLDDRRALDYRGRDHGHGDDIDSPRRTVYEPPRHLETGVDEDELSYEAQLVPVDEAIDLLGGQRSVMADVVRRGWEGVLRREALEEEQRSRQNRGQGTGR